MPNLNYDVPQDVPQDVPKDVSQNDLNIQIVNLIRKDNKISTAKMAMLTHLPFLMKLFSSSWRIRRFLKRFWQKHWVDSFKSVFGIVLIILSFSFTKALYCDIINGIYVERRRDEMGIHLNSLRINSFKGIQQLNLDHLNHINILTGNNNSGKTTILELLSTIDSPQNLGSWIKVGFTR